MMKPKGHTLKEHLYIYEPQPSKLVAAIEHGFHPEASVPDKTLIIIIKNLSSLHPPGGGPH